MLAALTAGAAFGFLIHNFHPASIYMGDSGSNLLGLLLGCIAVQGSLKTNALIALVGPLVILAVPFLDTGFVVAKRLKYRRKPWEADAEHFHHRLGAGRLLAAAHGGLPLQLDARPGRSGAGAALRALQRPHGNFHTGWAAGHGRPRAAGPGRQRVPGLRARDLQVPPRARARDAELDPDTTEHEIVERVERELETGEFESLGPREVSLERPVAPPAGEPAPRRPGA